MHILNANVCLKIVNFMLMKFHLSKKTLDLCSSKKNKKDSKIDLDYFDSTGLKLSYLRGTWDLCYYFLQLY